MDLNFQALSDRIRTIRESRGFTQEELAQSTGLSAHYIGNLEQGVRRPSLLSLIALCRALGVTPNDLFQDSISEEMLSGICVPMKDDPHALRDSSTALQDVFGDLLPLADDESCSLFGVPFYLLPPKPRHERFISLSELLDALESN